MKRRPPRAAPRLLGRARGRRSPLLQILGGVDSGGDEVRNFGDGGLHARFVEVGEEGVLEQDVIILEHAGELEELCAAVREWAGYPRGERLA